MSNRRWLLLTVLTTLLAAGAVVGANVAADIYGLWRDPAHRALYAYGDDRVAKYLLSTRYVQANFDGVLIGSSISANWDVGGMHNARLYNESLNGGNIVEEKAVLDHLLERPGTRMVLLVVHPYLTAAHTFNTVDLTPREVWGSIGSLNLLDAYKNVLKIRLGREPRMFDAAGTADFGDKTKKLNALLEAMMKPGEDFAVDPIALAAYRAVVLDLHARKIPIAFVIPPTSEPLFAGKRDAFAHYAQQILADRLAGDPLLDFTSDSYSELRRDLDSYADGVHLRGSATHRVTAVIDEQIKAWIAQGWLPHG
jgi:hypothetical protein